MQVQEYIMLKQECTTPYMPQNIDGSYSTVVTIFRQPAPPIFISMILLGIGVVLYSSALALCTPGRLNNGNYSRRG